MTTDNPRSTRHTADAGLCQQIKTSKDNIKVKRTSSLGNLSYTKLPKLCRFLGQMCDVYGNTWWTFARSCCLFEWKHHDFLWVGECRTTWKVEDDLDYIYSARWHFTSLRLCKKCYYSKYCSPTRPSFAYRSASDWTDIYLLYEAIHGRQALSLKENGDDILHSEIIVSIALTRESLVDTGTCSSAIRELRASLLQRWLCPSATVDMTILLSTASLRHPSQHEHMGFISALLVAANLICWNSSFFACSMALALVSMASADKGHLPQRLYYIPVE